ncbi:MAG TPA: DUF4124 domain-containing protein [Casimicrobiaceae bacterium]
MGALIRRIGVFTAVALAALVASPIVHAQVYRCKDANGSTTYSDAPCAHGGAAMKIPDAGRRGFGDTTVCGQLLDETHRLASEERRAMQNGAKKIDTSKRRRALVAQYERRCASIHRSPH